LALSTLFASTKISFKDIEHILGPPSQGEEIKDPQKKTTCTWTVQQVLMEGFYSNSLHELEGLFEKQ
jgi:hypothetical protein